MWIDVRIPYEPGNHLADAYNRAMENTTAEWVLLLDQDLFLTNPKWYNMSLYAIEQLKDTKVGVITCRCNSKQLANVQDSISYQIRVAQRYYSKEKDNLQKIENQITGFFMLVKKEVWKTVPFRDVGRGCDKIDLDFSQRIMDNGFEIYRINGLYLYHRRNMRTMKW